MVYYACVSPAHGNGTRVPGIFSVSVAEDVQEMSGGQHDGIGDPIPNSFLELTDTQSVKPAIHHLWLGLLDVSSGLASSDRERTGRATVVAVMY